MSTRLAPCGALVALALLVAAASCGRPTATPATVPTVGPAPTLGHEPYTPTTQEPAP